MKNLLNLIASCLLPCHQSFENYRVFEISEHLMECSNRNIDKKDSKSSNPWWHENIKMGIMYVDTFKTWSRTLTNYGTWVSNFQRCWPLTWSWTRFLVHIISFSWTINMKNLKKTLMEIHRIVKTIEASIMKNKTPTQLLLYWPLGITLRTKRITFLMEKVRPMLVLPIKVLKEKLIMRLHLIPTKRRPFVSISKRKEMEV